MEQQVSSSWVVVNFASPPSFLHFSQVVEASTRTSGDTDVVVASFLVSVSFFLALLGDAVSLVRVWDIFFSVVFEILNYVPPFFLFLGRALL